VRLVWQAEGAGGGNTEAMLDNGRSGDGLAGDGVFGAFLPELPHGTIVGYRIELDSQSGAMATYPPRPRAGGNAPLYLYEVDDDAPLANGSVTYRVILSERDLNTLKSRSLQSDVLLHATFIGEGEVHHLVGIRYRGETSRSRTRKSYRLEFPPEKPFRGCEVLLLNGSGTEGSVPRTALEDLVVSDMFRRSGYPYAQGWPVNLHFRGGVAGDLQGNEHVDPFYIRKEHLGRDFLSRYFGASGEGNLYRARDPQSGIGTGDLTYRGTDPDDYRRVYEKESNRDEDDFSDIIELTRAFDLGQTADGELDAAMLRLIDVRQWAAFFAIQDYCTNIDGGIHTNNGEDFFIYHVPDDAPRADAGLWLILPWDSDESFDNPDAGLFLTRVETVRRFIRRPLFARLYLQSLRTLAKEAGTLEEIRASYAHAGRVFPAAQARSVLDSMDGYVTRRLALIGRQVISGLDAAVPPAAAGTGVALVSAGARWSYHKGEDEPSFGTLEWAARDFDASRWPTGPSGFGYGDGDDATQLDDMQEGAGPGYLSLYIRKGFEVADPGAFSSFSLIVDYDDAFVAYLNGVEVARSPNMIFPGGPGEPIPHDSELGDSINHEASGGGSGANPPESFPIPGWRDVVVGGANVLALQGFNSTRDSSDFSLIPELVALPIASTQGGGWGSDLVVTGPSGTLVGSADASTTFSIVVAGVLAQVTREPPGSGPPYGLGWRAQVPFALGENLVAVEAYPGPDGIGVPSESMALRVLRVSGDLRRVGGSIRGDSSWSEEDGPYLIESSLRVEAGSRLTIGSGTWVFLGPGVSLTVEGRLDIGGTAERPVLFRAFERDSRWGRILFERTGTGAADHVHALRHVRFDLGHAPSDLQGFLRVRESRLIIEDVVMERIDALAVEAEGSILEMRRSEIRACRGGVAANGTTLRLEDCVVRDLEGGASAVLLTRNLSGRSAIRRSRVERSPGDGILIREAGVDVTANVIADVGGTGLAFEAEGMDGPSLAAGNVIRGARTGVSLSGGARVADGDHDTVAFCETGMRLSADASGSRSALDSMILWRNRQHLSVEGPFDLDLVRSCVGEGAAWPGEGNVAVDPLFADPFRGDFSLRPGSPCAGAGKGGTDMGATGFSPGGVPFTRGDPDRNDAVNLTDAIVILGYLFQGTAGIDCLDAADVDDDGKVDLTDAIYLLNFLFLGGPEVVLPYPEAGTDPTLDELPCG
jgi:hypothetical protein